jgi:hypothetical protein
VTKPRGILAPKYKWTENEDNIVRARYPGERAAVIAAALGVSLHVLYKRASTLGVFKSEEFHQSPESGRLDGVRGGSTRFSKGSVPWSKGLKGLQCSPATQFKPGVRPVNYMEVGSFKMHMGYQWQKISDGGWPTSWRPTHHVVWAAHHGKEIPEGHLISFIDRNRENFDPANLELISKIDWMKRHTLHNLPKELAELVQLRGALNRVINKRSTI